MADARPNPDRVAELMKQIRGSTSQVEAAQRSGLSQSMISRAEKGAPLKPAAARQYAQALGAASALRRELVALSEASAQASQSGLARLMRDGPRIQQRIRLLEQQSTEVRSWQGSMVPGQLQVWDYTLAVIQREPTTAWTAQRKARLELLDDPGRRFHAVVSEAVLRTSPGTRDMMRIQLDHLVELSRRPNIEFAVVPFDVEFARLPNGPFHIYDASAVEIHHVTGTAFLSDAADVATYRSVHDRMVELAVRGDDVRDLIQSARW